MAEKYDEVVFTNPKAMFHQSLLEGNVKKKLPYPLSNEQSVLEHFRTYGDEDDVKAMLAAKKFFEGELRNVKDRLLRVDAELDKVKHELAAAKEREKAAAAAAAAAGKGAVGAGVTGGGVSGGNVRGGTGGSKGKGKSKKKTSAAELQPAGKKAKIG